MFELGSIIGKYKILSELKGGAQGFVYTADDIETHEKLIAKSFQVEESKKKDFEKTMEVWKLLCKSKAKNFFVKYREHFFKGASAILIMEYCKGGDLNDLIKNKELKKEQFSEEEIAKMLYEAASGLQELHLHGMIHRDIKAANFLVGDDGTFKICDFNISKVMEKDTGASTMVGTPENTAPEIVKSEGYSYPVDLFSLGVVLYQMMVGKTPFVNEHGVNLVNLAMGRYEPLSTRLGYSQALIDLVHACLSVDPVRRPTPAQILAHPLVAQAQRDCSLHAAVDAAVDARTAPLEGALSALNCTVAEQQQTITTQQTAIRRHEATIAALQKTVAEQQQTVGEQKAAVAKLQASVEVLQRKADQADGRSAPAPAPPPQQQRKQQQASATPSPQPKVKGRQCLKCHVDLQLCPPFGRCGGPPFGPCGGPGICFDTPGWHCNKCGKNFCDMHTS